VASDTYYFQQLETGDLVNTTITRNPHVNNAVMSFAVLGAIIGSIKSTVWGYIMVIVNAGHVKLAFSELFSYESY
jgi:hypothetical protein